MKRIYTYLSVKCNMHVHVEINFKHLNTYVQSDICFGICEGGGYGINWQKTLNQDKPTSFAGTHSSSSTPSKWLVISWD
jgi:hypothetical protein